jgi:uridine kinase/RimJ/RimL family protein N-acetyltransferase
MGTAVEVEDRGPGSFSFDPVRREDLPLLEQWFAADHVSRWWGDPADADGDPLCEFKAVRRFIASLGGRPIGLVQIYRWSDFFENATAVGGRAGEVGIDYLVGEADLLGCGVGPAMIDAFLGRQTSGRGDRMGVRVDVSEENERSWRCLEKVGFRRDREGVSIAGQEGRHYVYVRDDDLPDAAASAATERVAALARSAPLLSNMRCRVLAIDGPGGSGKSTLAILVARELGDAPVIHTDDFASWDDQFGWYVRLIDQVLKPLASGLPARYQRYDWDRKELAEWHELEPVDFLIVEGVGASRRAMSPYLSASVWVQTSREERLRRGLLRDGQAALAPWQEWMRGEDEYIADERPEQRADLVVNGETAAS